MWLWEPIRTGYFCRNTPISYCKCGWDQVGKISFVTHEIPIKCAVFNLVIRRPLLCTYRANEWMTWLQESAFYSVRFSSFFSQYINRTLLYLRWIVGNRLQDAKPGGLHLVHVSFNASNSLVFVLQSKWPLADSFAHLANGFGYSLAGRV